MSDRRAGAVLAAFFVVFAITFAFLALVVDSRRRVIHGNDGAGYYAYVRSAVVDSDLDFANDFNEFFPGEVARSGWRTETGRTPNEYGVGFSLFALPFFLPAHGIVRLADALGFAVRADGGSAVEKLSACLASQFWGILGLWLAYKAVRTRFSPGISLGAVLLVLTSTNVVYYFVREPFLSHLDALFCVGLLLYCLPAAAGERSLDRSPLVLGATCGVLALVHPANAVYVVLPLLFGLLRQLPRVKRIALAAAAFLVGAGLAFVPQIVAWKIITGHYLPDPYPDQSFAYLFRPRVIEVLFSSNHGLLSWTPIVALAIAGLGILAKRQPALGLSCLAAVAALLYTYASWWQWWLGNSFGQRGFVSAAPIFALGLAAFLDRASRSERARKLWPLLGLFPLWNGILLFSYLSGLIPYAGTFSWVEFFGKLPGLPAAVLHKLVAG